MRVYIVVKQVRQLLRIFYPCVGLLSPSLYTIILFYCESCLKRNRKGLKFYSFAGRFFLIQKPEFWILRTPDTRNRTRFPLKTGFHYAKFTFKSGLTIFVVVHNMSGGFICCD